MLNGGNQVYNFSLTLISLFLFLYALHHSFVPVYKITFKTDNITIIKQTNFYQIYFFFKMKPVKIPVKIGSHLTTINVNDDKLICKNFIKIALIQCDVLNQETIVNSRTYKLFERLNGIDVIIRSNENIYNLWDSKWKSNSNFELVIKKYKKPKSMKNKNIAIRRARMQNNHPRATTNNYKSKQVKEFFISNDDEIKRDKMELKERVKQYVDQDPSYFENIASKNEEKLEDDLIVNNYFEEINDILNSHFRKN